MKEIKTRVVGNLEWDGLQKPRLYVAMAALLCGLFFSVMDGTVCNVALPTLAHDLQISNSDSIWIVNSFQLVIVMMLLPFAALGEVIGHRKVYLIGLLIFTMGSLFCALSVTFQWLVLARVIQGIGAAMVMSVNTSLVKLIYPKRLLGKGVGLNATVVALGLVVGPAFTGAVLSVTTWPWLFIINVPFGFVAFLLARKSLPENPTRVVGRRFDFKEALLNALAFGLFIGCLEAFSHDVNRWLVVIGLLLFVWVMVVYLQNQRHKEFPMLPFDLLRNPVFSISVLTSIVSFTSQMLAMVAMPFLLVHAFGYDAAQTGILMTAYPIVILFVAPLSGFLINRVKPQLLCCAGLLVLCIGSFLLAFMPGTSGFWNIAWRLAFCGLGFGFFQTPNNHLILSAAPTYRAGGASGMMALARLIGQTSGAASVAFLFHSFADYGSIVALLLSGVLSLLGMCCSLGNYYQVRKL